VREMSGSENEEDMWTKAGRGMSAEADARRKLHKRHKHKRRERSSTPPPPSPTRSATPPSTPASSPRRPTLQPKSARRSQPSLRKLSHAMESAAEVGANMLYALPSVVARADLVISDSAESVLDGCMIYVAVTAIASHFMTLREWIHVRPSDGDDVKADGLNKYAKYCAPPLPLIGGLLNGGNLAKGSGTVAMLGQTTKFDSSAAILAVIYLLIQALCTFDAGLVALQWLMAGSSELVASRVTFDVLRADLSSIMSARRKANQNQSSFSSRSLMRRVSVLLDRALVIMKSTRSSDKEKNEVDAFCAKVYSAFVSTRDASEWMRRPMPPAMALYTTATLTLVMVFSMAGDRQYESVRKHFGRGSSADDTYQYLLGTKKDSPWSPISDHINYFLHRKAETPGFHTLTYAKAVDIFHKFVPIPWIVPVPRESTDMSVQPEVETSALIWWNKINENETWKQLATRLELQVKTGSVFERVKGLVRIFSTLLLRALHATVVLASNFRLACYTSEGLEKSEPMAKGDGTTSGTCIDITNDGNWQKTSCTWRCSDGAADGSNDLRRLPACNLTQEFDWAMADSSRIVGVGGVVYVAAMSFVNFLWYMTAVPSIRLLMPFIYTKDEMLASTSYYGRAFAASIIGCRAFQAGCQTDKADKKSSLYSVPLLCPLGCKPLSEYGAMEADAMYCHPRLTDFLRLQAQEASQSTASKSVPPTGDDEYKQCTVDNNSRWFVSVSSVLVEALLDLIFLVICPFRSLLVQLVDPLCSLDGLTHCPTAYEEWSAVMTFAKGGKDGWVKPLYAPSWMNAYGWLTDLPALDERAKPPAKWLDPTINTENVEMMNFIWLPSLQSTSRKMFLMNMLQTKPKTGHAAPTDWSPLIPNFQIQALQFFSMWSDAVARWYGFVISIKSLTARSCAARYGESAAVRWASSLSVLGLGGFVAVLGVPAIMTGAAAVLLWISVHGLGLVTELFSGLLEIVCTVFLLNVQTVVSILGMFSPSARPLQAFMYAISSVLTLAPTRRLGLARWSTGMWLKIYRSGFYRHIAASLLVWPFGGKAGSGLWGVVGSLTDTWSGVDAEDKDEFGTRARQASARYLLMLSVWTGLQMRLQPNLACAISTWIDTLTSGRPDRTPGYDVYAVSRKLEVLFTKRPIWPGSSTMVTGAMTAGNLIADKEKYMSRGAGQCRILQRMDMRRKCEDMGKVVSRQAKHQLCTLKGEVDDAMLKP